MDKPDDLQLAVYWLIPEQPQLQAMIAEHRLNDLDLVIEILIQKYRLNYDQIAYVFEIVGGINRDTFEDLMYILDQRGQQ